MGTNDDGNAMQVLNDGNEKIQIEFLMCGSRKQNWKKKLLSLKFKKWSSSVDAVDQFVSITFLADQKFERKDEKLISLGGRNESKAKPQWQKRGKRNSMEKRQLSTVGFERIDNKLAIKGINYFVAIESQMIYRLWIFLYF